jgi:hypothetical protein
MSKTFIFIDDAKNGIKGRYLKLINNADNTKVYCFVYNQIDCRLFSDIKEDISRLISEETDTLVICGIGDSFGVLCKTIDTKSPEYIIDAAMAAKIKAKRVIGLWDNSLEFACANNLQGIFFDNFIYFVEKFKEFGVIYNRMAIEVYLSNFFEFLGILIDDNSVPLSEYTGKCVEWYHSEFKRNDFIRFLINNLKLLYKEVNNRGVLETYIQSVITNV